MIKPFEELSAAAEDLQALGELSDEDPSLESELEAELHKIGKKLDDYQLQAMLSGPQDGSNAFVKIQAGTGGTDACDWAQMLLRLYGRWAEDHGYQAELIDELRNEEAGIRSATLHVKGEYAYGYLQGESGVHRLVRISPFDSNARRQTSLAAVDVTPEIEGTIEIDIRPDELERQTFRSGGPGGQHQNKTESGVRHIHTPTGIAAESRSERSQHKNDQMALATQGEALQDRGDERARGLPCTMKRARSRWATRAAITSCSPTPRSRTYNRRRNVAGKASSTATSTNSSTPTCGKKPSASTKRRSRQRRGVSPTWCPREHACTAHSDVENLAATGPLAAG